MMGQQLQAIENALVPLRPMFTDLLRPIPALPAERLIRTIVVSCERSPRLQECTLPSLLQAATTGAVLGLEADGHTGQGFLVPFRRKGRGLQAQWLTGYKGYNTLAARSGLTLDADVVREGDVFEFQRGTSPMIHHVPLLGARPDRRIIAAWASAVAPSRSPITVVLDIDEILAVKARSQAAKRDAGADDDGFSPWNDEKIGFPAMAAKTARRRLARSLPLMIIDPLVPGRSFLAAARVDEAHEEEGKHAFIDPNKGLIIEGKAIPVEPPPSEPVKPFRGFVIKHPRGDIELNSIEQWRARMLDIIAQSSPTQAERFRARNQFTMDEYRNRRPAIRGAAAALEAVETALRERAATPAKPAAQRRRRSAEEERFFAQDALVVPGKTARELEYWLKHYLRAAQDPGEVDRIENDNRGRIAGLPRGSRDDIERTIAARRKELGGE